MSTNWLRALLIIVIVELLAIIGLVTWTILKPDDRPIETTSSEQTDGERITSSLIATGFVEPTNIVMTPIAGDEKLYVTERPGKIQIINKADGSKTQFLDITDKIKATGGEMGLLGLAFHPNFTQNGYFFVNYTDKNDNTIVARYQVAENGLANPISEKILLTVKQPYDNHNGGALAFGPDKFLYIALGDGGAGGDPQNRAQNKGDLLGKILRIDVNNGDPYAVPASNPFINEQGTKPEIWAWGLRNPWRISFDKQTGELYIADVGQSKKEEVNVQAAASAGGENYGWRCYEGTLEYNLAGCQSADKYVAPQFEYDHTGERCSVAGGYMYRGNAIPSLKGTYIFGDTCSGEIIAAKQSDGAWTQTVLLQTPYMISTFGEDQNGELYVADLKSGSIYQLEVH